MGKSVVLGQLLVCAGNPLHTREELAVGGGGAGTVPQDIGAHVVDRSGHPASVIQLCTITIIVNH